MGGFTYDELRIILPSLQKALNDFMLTENGNLKLEICGIDEQKILDTITTEQKKVLESLNFPGNRLDDLKTVFRDFENNQEVMQNFMSVVQSEEFLVRLALMRNNGQIMVSLREHVQNQSSSSAAAGKCKDDEKKCAKSNCNCNCNEGMINNSKSNSQNQTRPKPSAMSMDD